MNHLWCLLLLVPLTWLFKLRYRGPPRNMGWPNKRKSGVSILFEKLGRGKGKNITFIWKDIQIYVKYNGKCTWMIKKKQYFHSTICHMPVNQLPCSWDTQCHFCVWGRVPEATGGFEPGSPGAAPVEPPRGKVCLERGWVWRSWA